MYNKSKKVCAIKASCLTPKFSKSLFVLRQKFEKSDSHNYVTALTILF